MSVKVYNKTFPAQSADITSAVMLTVGAADASYCFKAFINATTSVATATAILTLYWTDSSGTPQTATVTIDATTLGAASIGQIIQVLRAQTATDISFDVVTANGPTFDLEIRLEKL